MDHPRKFEAATSSQSMNISELDTDREYPIVRAKGIATKFGLKTILTIQDADSTAVLQIFLPNRYSEVISDDDIDNIIKNSLTLNLILKARVQKPDLTC